MAVRSTPKLEDALTDPVAYPHPVSKIERVETHMSWLFLTGDYAYKVKKPIHFDFVDFSTLELREHFCQEEMRLNVSFAPGLYLDVVPVVRGKNGALHVHSNEEGDEGDEGVIEEWAVKMRQFDSTHQADVLVEQNRASTSQFNTFGRLLAAQHAHLTKVDAPPNVADAMRDNFKTLERLDCCSLWAERLAALRTATEQELREKASLLGSRATQGFVRDCHGDLHLSNMVAIDGALQAFDCLEFSPDLRAIDVWNDVAFLLMDCDLRGRADLAYACIDGYLESGADYSGLQLLPLYARYRSMVRAKVAALALDQQLDSASPGEPQLDGQKAAREKLDTHIRWTEQNQKRGPGMLIITCGLSGSGKSFWAKQLVPELKALRLRTDLYRKQRAGLTPAEHSESSIARGLYTTENSETIYSELADLCEKLLVAGETVIADAACLKKHQRDILLAAGKRAHAATLVLHMKARAAVLRRRIKARNLAGTDPSEADESVLEWQLGHHEAPISGPQVLAVDTETVTRRELVRAILATKPVS